MNDARRPDGESNAPDADTGAAESPENNPKNPDRSSPGIELPHDGRDAETESCGASAEPGFGFAPGIELADKRAETFPKMPDKPGFGFAPEIELSAKRDAPPARTPYGRSNHAAQSNAHVLPYEAAKLAASASLLRKPRLEGKLVPVCLAAIISTVGVGVGRHRVVGI